MDSGKAAENKAQSAVGIVLRKMKDGTLKDILIDWKWILSFSQGHWGEIVVYTLFGVVTSVLSLVTGIVSKYLIDAIVYMNGSRMVLLIALLLLGAVFSVVFRSLSARFSAKLSIDMQNDVQAKVFDSLISSDWMSISQFPTGDLLSRFSTDVQTVSNCAVSWLPKVIIQTFTVLATLGVILYYDPMMALIGLASAPVLFFTSKRLMKLQRDHNRKMREVSSNLSSFQSETFRNMDTLKSFGIERSVSDNLRRWQNTYREAALDYNLFSIQTSAMMTAVSTAVQYIALGYCLWRLWRGEILFGTMVLFLQQRSTLSNAFSALVSLVPTALSGSIAAERVQELINLNKETESDGDHVHCESCHVWMKNVKAEYGSNQPVLQNVSIHAAPGEIVALVGPSGEGKTTLLRLLLSLIRPTEGEVYLEDQDGICYPLGPDTRHCFAYVPQGNTVLAGTIEENLRLGNETATQDEMIAALQDACAWEFVSEMPQGLHSLIGEGGKGLSEGQAQRISIARALLRKAPVMLLDEVTSALDRETERRVLENLMHKDVTCIVTTHRPSVLNMCSRVYHVESGRVAQMSNEEVQTLVREI